MYQMSPEDRLQVILRQKNEMREQAVRERIAAAAAARRTADGAGARDAGSAGAHRPWTVGTHLLQTLTAGHWLARRGVAR